MIDVTIQNFETEVIAASMSTPVLVDFWADWCGPCKQLGPMLEKLEEDYAGRFKLVKINADEEQQLAGAFGIRSLPTCILLMGGKPVDGFMGAIPPAELRAFLDKHIPSEEALLAESETEEAEALLESGDTEAAMAKLADAVAADPGNDDARFDYARLLIAEGGFEEARALLAEPLSRIPKPLRFEALLHWMEALEFVSTDERGQWALTDFDARIAENKRDFETRFAKSRMLIALGMQYVEQTRGRVRSASLGLQCPGDRRQGGVAAQAQAGARRALHATLQGFAIGEGLQWTRCIAFQAGQQWWGDAPAILDQRQYVGRQHSAATQAWRRAGVQAGRCGVDDKE